MTRHQIQYIKEEETESYSDDSLFNIKSWGADLSFRELIDRYKEDDLEKPELQRHYVWDKTEASRFIDSILLGLPVPSIFLAQTKDEKLLIIDGYQRIMTVHDFVGGIFSKDGKPFQLSRSDKINKRWRGKSFLELTEPEQRRVKNTTIHAIIFSQQSPAEEDTSLFQVFERINTSGRTLLPQEIRNCVAQGTLNTLLFNINKYDKWRKLFGSKEIDTRMRDIELILRFFALSSSKFKKDKREKISLRRFLDVYMKENANISNDRIEKLKHKFIIAIDLVYASYGSTAFHNISLSESTKTTSKFSPTIFDSILIAASRAIKEKSTSIPKNSQDAKKSLLQNEEYRTAISKETMTKHNINKRIELARKYLFGENNE